MNDSPNSYDENDATNAVISLSGVAVDGAGNFALHLRPVDHIRGLTLPLIVSSCVQI